MELDILTAQLSLINLHECSDNEGIKQMCMDSYQVLRMLESLAKCQRSELFELRQRNQELEFENEQLKKHLTDNF